jgi:hypothetical protein
MAKSDELRIRGVEKIKNELQTIAKNKGISLASYLKPKLRDIIDSEADKFKRQSTV